MSLTKDPGLIGYITDYVQGEINSSNYKEPSAPIISPFVRMVVLDVIFDPQNDIFDEKKKAYWQSIDIVNMDWVNILPRNTVVAKKVGEDSRPFFLFPFFPSHLALPCKPGECVWAMFEETIAGLNANSIKAYWFCRITEPHVVDDVNHTHAPRVFEPTLFPSIKDISENNNSVIHELRNGPVVTKPSGERATALENIVLSGEEEDIFEKLIQETDSSKLMAYESIPRYRKRPGDLALEGTNNTLIVLGTDRTGVVAEYTSPTTEEEIATRSKIAGYPQKDFRDSAGSIDIVAGRGQVELTYGKQASTTTLITDNTGGGTEIKKELDKSFNALTENEGNPDLVNDRSRILVSQRTSVDQNLGISPYNLGFIDPKVEDSEDGDAAIVIKSDKIRMIARSDVEIMVTNFTEQEAPNKKKIKKDSIQLDEWASITIKSSGDIVFKPSRLGYIKLGADDANKAILCTDLPATMVEGNVSFKPGLITTGASVVGTGQSGQGTFAKKVLVK